MKTEKGIIAFSIIAIIIGVSSIIPLTFLMNTPTAVKADTTNESWFTVDMPYAYWITGNGPLDDDFELNETNSVHELHNLCLNFTLNLDTTKEDSDARVEYYLIEISSDKELIETMRFYIGTNSNSSFKFGNLLEQVHFFRQDWYDLDMFAQKYGGGGGTIRYNWTVGESNFCQEAGSGEGTLSGSGSARRVTAFREAETVSVTLYRIGWATFAGDSTIFTTAHNEIVDQIQLEKYGEESWLYNDLVPEDELAEMDLLHPISRE